MWTSPAPSVVTGPGGSTRLPSSHPLVPLVALAATGQGRTEGRLPQLSFWRFDTPQTLRKAPVPGVALGVTVQGSKVVDVDGCRLAADATRHLVLTRETQMDCMVMTPANDAPYLGLSVAFPPEMVARLLLALADAGAAAPPETSCGFVADLDAPLVDTLMRLLQSTQDPVDVRLLAPLVLEELGLRLLRSDAAAAMRSAVVNPSDAVKIQQAMHFIRTHASRPLTVQQIARHVGMSPSHFAHRFSALARLSPMRFVRLVRLEAARARLLAGARPSEASAAVGFESASHFTREFKRHFGAAPGLYARKLRLANAGARVS